MDLKRTERFAAKVEKIDDCWIWTGSKGRDGYGNFWDGQRSWLAHRWAYTQHIGPIPGGLTLDHLCRHRACVNPAHLEPVTHAENLRRSAPAQKTHCANGHEYTPENTYIRKASAGRRDCLTCREERSRRQYEKTKADRPEHERPSTCGRGHDMTDPANVYRPLANPNYRVCRVCARDAARARRARKEAS